MQWDMGMGLIQGRGEEKERTGNYSTGSTPLSSMGTLLHTVVFNIYFEFRLLYSLAYVDFRRDIFGFPLFLYLKCGKNQSWG